MRKGDTGITDLIDKRGVKKCAPRVRALAHLDELSAALGYARLKSKEKDLEKIQKFLISVCAVIAGGKADIKEAADFVEQKTAALEKKYKAPRVFLLPGKNGAETALHLARAKCRTAETYLAGLKLDKNIPLFINRLSKYLFFLAVKHTIC